MNLEERLIIQLEKRRKQGNLRQLKTSNHLTDFCSNDYIGLAQNQHLKSQIQQTVAQFPHHKIGATGSRLISGNSDYALQLEHDLAIYFQAETALLFNSGYQANAGILATIPQKNDTILCDELVHASLKEGARLSFAQKRYFKHNDLVDLEKKLQKATGMKFIVLESVYSMDGDCGDLENILNLAEKYQAYTILDEAHGVGVFGQNGEGLACSQKLADRFFARIYTFGKAVATHGACIVGSKILTQYLLNFTHAFIYTTALPFHGLVSIRCAFDWIKNHPELQMQLHRKIKLFRDEMNRLGLLNTTSKITLKKSNTPIQILQIGGNQETKKMAEIIVNQGFDVRPILSPTVKLGAEIIRICLHTSNTDAQIIGLVKAIQHAYLETFER